MKKLFKGIISTTLVGAVAFSLVGCGGSSDSGSASGDSDVATADETQEDVATESGDTLTMGTNAEFPPYEFYEGGEVVGIDAEIAGLIAEKLGKELIIEDMAFDTLIPAVKTGKIDIAMAGMTVTEERLQNVDFSDSYATGIQVVIVPEGSDITTVDDLFEEGNDYKIGVQSGTTGDLYATWDFEDEGLATLDRYNKGADAVQALIAGKIDCVMIDNEPAKAYVSANDGLEILDTEYVIEEYAIALDKGSALTDEVNEALKELIADGSVDEIIEKYISAE